jgi:hypothetical protein
MCFAAPLYQLPVTFALSLINRRHNESQTGFFLLDECEHLPIQPSTDDEEECQRFKQDLQAFKVRYLFRGVLV